MSGYQRNEGNGKGLPGYIDVAERLNTFWQEMRATKTPARIESEIVQADERSIIVRAAIYMHFADIGWVRLADGYAEDMRASAPKGKCLEVAQTSAVGRALAMAGYASSEKIASRDEMESYYAAQEAETREQGTPNAPEATEGHAAPHEDKSIVPEAKKAPQATTARRKPAVTAATVSVEQTPGALPKVGVTTAMGTTTGATLGEAVAKQEQLNIAGLPASEIASPKLADAVVTPVSKEQEAEAAANAELEQHSPGFRKWIDARYEDAENGNDFATIAEKFKALKEKMTDAQYTTARKHLAIIKRRCEAIAASGDEEQALKADVATELAQLTDEERKFLSA